MNVCVEFSSNSFFSAAFSVCSRFVNLSYSDKASF